MENRAYAIATGLFALLLSLGIGLGFWWLGGPHTEQQEYVILSSHPVSGLNQEAAVKFRGVNVGKVADIDFDPARPLDILITISVDKRLKLTRGTVAQLRMQGVTGLAFVDLDDTGKDPKPLGDARIPLGASPLESLADTGQQFLTQARLLVDNSNHLVESGNRLLNQHNIEHIEQTLNNLEQSTRELAPLLQAATRATRKIDSAFSEEQQHKLAAAADAIRHTAEQAGPLIQDIRQAATDFHALSAELRKNSKELSGSLSSEILPRIDEMTRRLTHDAQRLGALLDNLEQNPQSLLFGNPQNPPGPGEPGFKP